MELSSLRLRIRPWKTADLASFAETNADPIARKYYFPSLLSRTESDAVVSECNTHLESYGFGFMAVERKSDGALIGGAGLSHVDLPPTGPTIEIGWIFGRQYWRRGYGREAGQAWLAHAKSIELPEVIGYTTETNMGSRRLMESLGMHHDAASDFDDPSVPAGHELSPHVIYRFKPNAST